jgi:methylenetetrahydrofolate dehydrogenase (NADP+)/methenyltetrahydrofolate cyclohydrolase
MAERLIGAPVSQKIQNEILAELSSWAEKKWAKPRLTVILVDTDPASQVYVSHKQKMCEAVGFDSEVISLPSEVSESVLISKINMLNADQSVDAILVQLPLPKPLNERKILECISAEKDVDCLTEKNLGKLLTKTEIVLPCTPSGIIEILKFYKIKITGKNVAVIGRSLIVGMPLFYLLNRENATVTLFHSKSEDLKSQIKNFDIVCVALGSPHFLSANDFKTGAVVIDVGIHRAENKLTGDVNFLEAERSLSAYTPVPGGVGPMTIAMLMKNTMSLARERRQK